jgi:hypothetical protein
VRRAPRAVLLLTRKDKGLPTVTETKTKTKTEGCQQRLGLLRQRQERRAERYYFMFYVIGNYAQVEVKHTVQRSAYCLSNQEHQEDHEQGACSSSARDEQQPGEQPGPAAATCAREKARRGAHAQGEWVALDPDDLGFVVGVPALTDLAGVSLALSLPCDCLLSVRAYRTGSSAPAASILPPACREREGREEDRESARERETERARARESESKQQQAAGAGSRWALCRRHATQLIFDLTSFGPLQGQQGGHE